MNAVGVRMVGLTALVILFLWQQVAAQEGDSLKSVILDPIEVSGTWLHDYAIGSRTVALDSVNLETRSGASLSELLQVDQGIYLRDYGPGMLSSISLRGTAAHHTVLLWNGLPANYPSLGQADFSLLPAFFIDNAEVFYGGNGALAGSGTIGGAVGINDRVERQATVVRLSSEVASFGTLMAGVKAAVAGSSAGISVATFHKRSDNNYPYTNYARPGQPVERQANGAFEASGLKATGFWRPWRRGTFDWATWLTTYHRQIIPAITASSADVQDDKSDRASLGYNHRLGTRVKLSSRVGWIRDRIAFNQLLSATAQYLWNADAEWRGKNLEVKGGGLLSQVTADVNEYGGELAEGRADIYLMTNWFPASSWEVSARLRRSYVASRWAPFSPSVGLSGNIWRRGAAELTWRAQASGSYRVPTLNDRYWSPGGNPDLAPERGWNVESGVDAEQDFGSHLLTASLTAYAHWIHNWILWLPQAGGYWSPRNVRNVLSSGGELSLEHRWSTGSLGVKSDLDYKFTSAIVRQGYTGDAGNVGNQLPYVPTHQGAMRSRVIYRKWQLAMGLRHFGRRFTLVDNDVALAPYTVWDISVWRTFEAGNSSFDAGFRVDNLFNKAYENLQYRPMPGRSFSFQLNYTFKQNSK